MERQDFIDKEIDMNYKLASMSLALAGALAFAGVGCAQSPNGQAASTHDSTQAPPNTGINNGMDSHAHAGVSMMDFSRVAGNKGYITRQQAKHEPWLKSHFDQCDTNHDGRIDRSEFDQCRMQEQQENGTMRNQPAAGSTS